MRKLFMAAFLAVAFSASAQEKGNIEFGVNTGVNFSNVRTSNLNSDSSTGFNVGVMGDFFFSDRWSIKARLVYDRKGWDNGFIEGTPNGSYTTDYNLDYLTIPVMANYHFGSKRNWYLNFGAYSGFLLSAKETEGGLDVKEGFNSSDFGLALGIGVKIPVSDKAKIFIEYEEQTGFSEIFKENDGPSIMNSRGSLNLGICFLLK